MLSIMQNWEILGRQTGYVQLFLRGLFPRFIRALTKFTPIKKGYPLLLLCITWNNPSRAFLNLQNYPFQFRALYITGSAYIMKQKL